MTDGAPRGQPTRSGETRLAEPEPSMRRHWHWLLFMLVMGCFVGVLAAVTFGVGT